MYNGSCLCGAVVFEITGEIKNIIYCHCSKCRKAQGSAFATNGNLDKKHFNIIRGKEKLTEYKVSQDENKFFCKKCGSPIMSENNLTPSFVRVRLGTIEGEIKERPEAHIFVSSKANWEEIQDELPKYTSYK